MEGIISFHNDMMFFDTFILLFVTTLMVYLGKFLTAGDFQYTSVIHRYKFFQRGIFHNTIVEII